MEQKDFYRILEKYRLGQASSQEKKLIEAWYEALGNESDSVLPREKEEELEKRYWANIDDQLNIDDDTRQRLRHPAKDWKAKTMWPAIGFAASVLLVAIAFIYTISSSESPTKEEIAVHQEPLSYEEIINSENHPRLLTLPDGSLITLEPGSSVKWRSDFNTAVREIRLEGQAFFEVVRNEQRPFIVRAREVTTKVLGTSFTVRAFAQDKNVTVAVKTGRVSVSTNDESRSPTPREFILTPNQELIYNKDKAQVERKIVEAPQPILPEEEVKRMRFKRAPVSEIFEAIEKVYGVDIEFDEALFSSCTLTTSISDGDLYNRLTIITSAIGAKYTMKENKIVISGTGCN